MTQSVAERAAPIPPPSELRSWWEVPCIAHFCNTFSESLELPVFEIEELELALLAAVHEEVHPLIVDIHIAFLKGILEKKEIGPENWELLLKLHFVWRCEFLNEKYNPMGELSYKQIHTRTKVEILHRLCHWRLELDDVTDCLKSVDPQDMRLEEIGTDQGGHKYWYFYGMRLYRESKEAQQYTKRSKTSSSLRSRPSEAHKGGTPSNSGGKKPQVIPKTPRSRIKRNILLAVTGDTSDVDSCASGEDSARQESTRRVTRSARKAASEVIQGSQETSRHTDSSSPVAETGASLLAAQAGDHPSPVVGDNEFSARTGWSVVCACLKDWQELVSSLEESTHSCEVQLCECLREELLPSLTQIEADRSRTLPPAACTAAMVDGDSSRRVSERLHNKLKPSYMCEQISFMGVPEHPRKSRQSPECGEGETSEGGAPSESESFDSEMEMERKREKEERREKSKQEWEEAYSGNIQGPRKKVSQPGSTLVSDLEEEMIGEDLRIAMLKLVDELKKHEDCWPFVDPVTEAIAPGYNDVITRPMDVLSVEKKLKNEEYCTKEQFVRDFRRIFKNCKHYNGAESEYTEMAETIRQHFNKLFSKFFPQPGTVGRRVRSPILPVGSSSDSDAEPSVSQLSIRTPVGVKSRRKRKTGEPRSGAKPGAPKRTKSGDVENQGSDFSNYPPFYPPYPTYHPDKEDTYPPFPREFPPFSYFPPFLSTPHPPYPSFPPYWGQRSAHTTHGNREHKHRYRDHHPPPSGCPGSTKERREEEAKLQDLIHTQGFLGRQKRDKVSSTTAEQRTAEQSSMSSPDSVTPVHDVPVDPARGESKGTGESRTSSSSSLGAGFPSHAPRHYNHLPRLYPGAYYPSPYLDYMMDPYLHLPPFYDRPGPVSPLPHVRHRMEPTETAGQGTEDQGSTVPPPLSGEMETRGGGGGRESKEGEPRAQKVGESAQEDTPNPSPDQFPALTESHTPTTAKPSDPVEEQPHSTTEEADTQHTPNKELTPSALSPSKRVKSRPPHSPYYPQRPPYAPLPYPFYPPSPYSPHGYSHPPYDPYFAADMMAWQQQHALQGMHSSKKRIGRPPSADSRYRKPLSDPHRLPPYPGAPSSPEDFLPPYFYTPPHPLSSKQRKHKSHYETDVLPPPTAYCLQDSAADDASNVPDYKESLADYALHLAGGSRNPSSGASNLKPDIPSEDTTPQEHLNEEPLPISDPLLSGMQASAPGTEEQLVQNVNYNVNNNNNNNNNDNENYSNTGDYSNLESHIFSLPYTPPSPHFMQKRHAPLRPNTLGSFFLPSASRRPLLPPVPLPGPARSTHTHKSDLKLEWLKQKQAQFNEWLARVNSQSRNRFAQQISQRKHTGPEVGHSHTFPSPPPTTDKSEV